MKIGIFTDCYYPQINGVVTSIMTLKEILEKYGHEVYIVTGKDKHTTLHDEKIIFIPSIPFFRWSEFKIGLPWFAVREIEKIKSINFDIIHTQTEITIGKLGQKIAGELNIPLIHTYHTQHEEYTHYISSVGTPLLKKIIRKLSKIFLYPCSTVIVPSDKIKRLLLNYGVKNDIYVIPTGIKLSNRIAKKTLKEKPSYLMNKFGFKENNFILLFLGRVSLEKNIDAVINVLPQLIKIHDKIRLFIVGTGPYLKNIKKRVEKENLLDYVDFAGRVEHEFVTDYFAVADLFISPSKTETQGLTIFEAIESKTPVLVYDDTNVEDIIFDNKTGLLFKTETELIEKILFALNNQERLNVLAEAAYTKIQHYSDAEFGEQIISIYNHTIQAFNQSKAQLNKNKLISNW